MRYTISEFHSQFPDEEACLQEMFVRRYGKLSTCPKCNRETNFYRVRSKKCYACQFCGYQLSPLAGTIFHKSATPLKLWFFAIFLFSTSRNGVSAMELQRQLGVTYKCAHRIAKHIRKLMAPKGNQLSGTVEMDETLVGGYRKGDIGGNTKGTKQTVIGAVERGGRIKAQHTQNRETHTIINMINADVALGSHLITDEYPVYRKVKQLGYGHDTVKHAEKQYVAGLAHTNTIEGFWSQLKRSLNGTYHAVSPRYLQSYVNEFAWRYNQRQNPKPMFLSLLDRA